MEVTDIIDASEIVRTVANEIKHEYEYVRIQGQTLWYSRYYGGGSFSGCCTIHLVKATMLTIDGYETSDRTKLLRKFDLADPNSFEDIGKFLRVLFDREWPDRPIRTSELPLARPHVTEYHNGPNQVTLEALKTLK